MNKQTIGIILIMVIGALFLSNYLSLWIPEQTKLRPTDETIDNLKYLQLSEEGEVADNIQIYVEVHAEVSRVKSCTPYSGSLGDRTAICKSLGYQDWEWEMSCPAGQAPCFRTQANLGNNLRITAGDNEIFNQFIVDGQAYTTQNIAQLVNQICNNGDFISECIIPIRFYATSGEAILKLSNPSSHITTDTILADELGIIDKTGDETSTPPSIVAPTQEAGAVNSVGGQPPVVTSLLSKISSFFRLIFNWITSLWTR